MIFSEKRQKLLQLRELGQDHLHTCTHTYTHTLINDSGILNARLHKFLFKLNLVLFYDDAFKKHFSEKYVKWSSFKDKLSIMLRNL